MTSTTSTTQKQFNIWAVQDELNDNFRNKELENKLKVLRDQYINSLLLEKSSNILNSDNTDNTDNTTTYPKPKKIRCLIL